MPTICVAFGCNDVSNLEKGIALHIIPFFGDARGENGKNELILSKITEPIGSQQSTRRCAQYTSSRKIFKDYLLDARS